MSHRFLLRLLTNLALSILTFSCFGIVLWVIDEFLQWDILPDAISMLVQALLVAGGIIAFVIVVMNVILSLTLIAESSASRAQLPDHAVSQQLRRRVNRSILAVIVAIALIIGGLQIVNQTRARLARGATLEQFERAQAQLNQSAPDILNLFTPPILEGIANNNLTEKGQLGNTTKLFQAIQSSFPQSPYLNILVKADQDPYEYALITPNSIRANTDGKTALFPTFYINFPDDREATAIEQLFAEDLPSVTEPLQGKVLDNTTPSTWGILKRNQEVIAIVSIKSGEDTSYYDGAYGAPIPYNNQYGRFDFHHDGPGELFSN